MNKEYDVHHFFDGEFKNLRMVQYTSYFNRVKPIVKL